MTFEFDRVVLYWVHRLSFLARKDLQRRLNDQGFQVTPEEWALLMHLWRQDGQTTGELAATTFRDRTTVTRLVDGMVGKGHVERRPDPGDRRRVRVHLTKNGQGLQEKLVPIARGLIADAVDGIAEDDVAATMRTLRRMMDNLSPKTTVD